MRPRATELADAGCDPELRRILAVTRRLPSRGPARWLSRRLRKLYLRRPRPDMRAEVGGCRMRLRPGDYVDGQLLFAPQGYEAEERAWVETRLRPGDVFVDLGAHVGLYTLLAARIVGPAGRVLAVEANPETFARLEENVRENGFTNVRSVACGVSDRAEIRKLGRTGSSNTGAASFLETGGGEVEVECLPLATLLGRAGLERVSGMKLDIEGFEYPVLERFFAEAPARLHPGFVLIEHKPRLVERVGGDALDLLRTRGYHVAFRATARRGWPNYGLVRGTSA